MVRIVRTHTADTCRTETSMLGAQDGVGHRYQISVGPLSKFACLATVKARGFGIVQRCQAGNNREPQHMLRHTPVQVQFIMRVLAKQPYLYPVVGKATV